MYEAGIDQSRRLNRIRMIMNIENLTIGHENYLVSILTTSQVLVIPRSCSSIGLYPAEMVAPGDSPYQILHNTMPTY